ncbi:serine/threonine/tyrosine-interacting-like protein 2 [Scleropages formosus]|uniref:Dual specificity phosphatase 27 n=1 Tax=Scleropages formosus TaxID=113540 RepID=A0A8C9QUF1_SCLFO|nr:inactive dual specificity phosphatase 27 [Scleropages formosus]
MASHRDSDEAANQVVPQDDDTTSVRSIQSHYLRSPSPSRFSVVSDTDTESIFMEPIHLSSTMAAKKIINEELKPKEVKVEPVSESMLESAEQLMVEDLYNRVKDMMDDSSPYNTPCVLDIQRAVVQDRLEAPFNPVDEVWPSIFIGEQSVAVNKSRLKRLGITHILNAAHGTGVYTGPDFYAGMNIQYMGIEVDDFPDVDISPHLRSAAEFLDEALLTHKGKVLVDSVMGVSRSAVLVAAYLMIFHHMTIMEALLTLRKKRAINPNEGFLKQLRELNEELLEERDGDDDSDTLSQSSVIEAHPCQQGKAESILGARAHSIQVEEEDGASVMSSVMSMQKTAATAREDYTEEQSKSLLDEEDEEDDLNQTIREWQKRNEKYQSEDWWQAQLMSEDDESMFGGSRLPEDGESVTSADIQALKDKIEAGVGRCCQSAESVITNDSSNCADVWKERLREIEEQITARYRSADREASESDSTDREVDEESLLSDTGSSLLNFCKKNKDKLTPLERWRIKRIQFGWNKKDAEAEKGAGGEQDDNEGEERKAPLPADVNLTAYQSWKLKQQKKLGAENKDEVVELGRHENPVLVKRRQRREEILERSKQTLEESQSMCGWDTESSFSSSTIPLSAFWSGVAKSASGDDTSSMLSMQSGRSSTLSQAHSTQGPPLPQVPMVPLPNMQGPGNEVLNLASIQNWIANVVTETLIQKQNEMRACGSLPPSRPASVFSLGPKSYMNMGRGLDDDKVSMLSGATGSSVLSRGEGSSVLSAGGASSISGTGSRKGRISTTSVPLYSLFQDQVDLQKLNSMDKEMRSEMMDKMAAYEVKKIAEDNKRSTLFKKKKPKEDSDEDGRDNAADVQSAAGRQIPAGRDMPSRTLSDLAGRLGSEDLDRDKTSNIDRWLDGISAPSRSSKSFGAKSSKPQATMESTNGTFASRRKDFQEKSLNTEEEDYVSRFSSKAAKDQFSSSTFRLAEMDPNRSVNPELSYHSRSSTLEKEDKAYNLMESRNYGTRRSYSTEEEADEELEEESAAKRKFSHYSMCEDNDKDVTKGQQEVEDDDEEDVTTFISRCRQRSKALVESEMDNDAIINAWRTQQESKFHSSRGAQS